MENDKTINDPYVKKDLRMLALTVFIVAAIFAATAVLDAKTDIISKISRNIYLATLNNN